MNHNLSQPCPHCPFRTDIQGYLRADRVQEICASIMQGQSFPCHKTTEKIEDDDGYCDMTATEDSEQCAGAEIFLAKQGMSSQMARIAERLGMPVAKLNMDAPVCGTVMEMLEVHGWEEPEGEPCSVCDEDCLAPAGRLEGGAIIEGFERTTLECGMCGEAVCENCSEIEDGERVCRYCQEVDEGE